MRAILSADLAFNLDLSQGEEPVLKSKVIAEPQRLKIIHRNEKMPCNQVHVRQFDESALTDLAEHQMRAKGKHKCCKCAYNSGYEQGSLLQTFISLDIESLGDAHTRANGRFKSVHQAFALGYNDGVNSFIRN